MGGMEPVGEGLSQTETAFPFLGQSCILFGPLHALSVRAAQRKGCCLWGLYQASFPNPPSGPAEIPAP